MKRNTDLATLARETLLNAYAPYSGYRVGAVVETESGDLYTGCNVENASYGLTICAERVAVAKAVSEGHTRFRRLVVATEVDRAAPPCGACRQFVAEFGKDTVVCSVSRKEQLSWQLKDLIPDAFTADHLDV